MLADIISPVSLFLRLRDEFTQTLLLESSDYHGAENSKSYICFDPHASFEIANSIAKFKMPDQLQIEFSVDTESKAVDLLNQFISAFDIDDNNGSEIARGVFGYINYEAVRYFEDIEFTRKTESEIPEIRYQFFKYIIVIDHFKNELFLYHFIKLTDPFDSSFDQVVNIIKNFDVPSYPFRKKDEEKSNYTDDEFLKILQKGKDHCQAGDVFQIVLSRRFQSKFKGDEFNVYRALRSINPSPYLFYFDYGNYKIFGSSPEAQIVIKDNMASIFPIAGTFPRSGSDDSDQQKAIELANDPKENSEHIMLVDLARNDLSRKGNDVKVSSFKEVQFYSHVIHLVSKVTAVLNNQDNAIQIVADTFPAGTLSGAPKYRAMQLINDLESTTRGYYGGAIGFLGFNGDFNHAIMIRSFFSKNNTLTYQAGAGVVAKSIISAELNEVNNKLGALRAAINLAEEL